MTDTIRVISADQQAAIAGLMEATTLDAFNEAADRAERLGVLDLLIHIDGWEPDTYCGVRRWALEPAAKTKEA